MHAEYLTPVLTAFAADGSLDEAANRRLYDYVIHCGVDGILLGGSAGEFYALTTGEMKQLTSLAARHIGGRVPLLVGTGRMQLEETLELSQHARQAGAQGVLVITPYYTPLTDEDTFAYYDAFARGYDGDIYIYNFPAGTGKSISPAVVARLARSHRHIVGLKDSVAAFGSARDILAAVRPHRPDFKVYSGYDDNFAHNILAGGSGGIGALSNIVPGHCAAWARAVTNNDVAAMADSQRWFDAFMRMYTFSSPFMPAMKHALALLGVLENDACRFPTGRVGDEGRAGIRALLEKMELL